MAKPLTDDDFRVTGITDILFEHVAPNRAENEGDALRLGFSVRFVLAVASKEVGPIIRMGSSVAFDPALTWSQTETRIAERILELLGVLRDLTREQILTRLADSLRPVPPTEFQWPPPDAE